jgi:hypothetical protein
MSGAPPAMGFEQARVKTSLPHGAYQISSFVTCRRELRKQDYFKAKRSARVLSRYF